MITTGQETQKTQAFNAEDLWEEKETKRASSAGCTKTEMQCVRKKSMLGWAYDADGEQLHKVHTHTQSYVLQNSNICTKF